jgi:hypothetical protein
LINNGFELGKDFSFAGGSLVVSPEVKEYILNQVPPERRDQINQFFHEKASNPWTALEEDLGAPFFKNLVEIARERIKEFTDLEAMHYLWNIMKGVSNRHPAIKDQFPAWLTENIMTKERLYRIANLAKSKQNHQIPQDSIASVIWIEDLIFAAGGEQYINGEYISLEGYQLLAKVFRGDDDSLYRIIADLKQARQNQ